MADKLLLLSAILSCLCASMCTSQSTIYYVTPNVSTVPCPQEPCHEFHTYYQNQLFYFQSYTQFIFLPGEHKFDFGGLLLVQDKENISLVGSANHIVHTVAEKVQEYGFDSYEEDWNITYLESSTKIICSNLSGFVFAFVSNLVLSNLSMVSCGQYSPLTSLNASIQLYNVDNLLMDGVSVQNSTGYGMIGTNVLGYSEIVRSSFIGNNQYVKNLLQKTTFGGLLCNSTNDSSITAYVNNGSVPCQTTMGGNLLLKSKGSPTLKLSQLLFALGLDGTFTTAFCICRPVGTGLVISIQSQGPLIISVDIEDTVFYRNQASLGANLHLEINGSHAITLNNIRSILGLALNRAGGLTADIDMNIPSSSNLLRVTSSLFKCNYALVRPLYLSLDVTYSASRSDSINGTALTVVDACVLSDGGFSFRTLVDQLEANFRATLSVNGTLFENFDSLFFSANAKICNSVFTSSRLLAMNSAVNLSGFVQLNNNSDDIANGGAMYLSSTNLTVESLSQITFINNTAPYGGAIFVDTSSHMAFESPCNVSFINNNALVSGGAIFVKDPPVNIALSTLKCFFSVSDAYVQLYFSNNHAGEAGSVLYGGYIDLCYTDCVPPSSHQCPGSSVFNETFIDGGGNEYPSISSDPTSVCPCNGPCLSSTLMNFTVYPGQSIDIAFITVGQQNSPAPSVVILYTISPSVRIVRSIQTSKNCSNYSIPYTLENQTMLISTQDALFQTFLPQYSFNISININLQCPQCFVLKDNACICNELLSANRFQCNINDQTATYSGQQWIGNTPQGILAIYDQCPFDYCSHDGNINLTDFSSQCNHNRSGVLCGQCLPGLSTTFGALQCKSCSNYNLFLIIPFAIMGLALVIFLFALNLTVSAGTLYGMIFYANIFRINDSIFLPEDQRNLFVQFLSWCIAWLNLDFGIEACFYDSMDSYAKTWLQFVFPTYIFSLVGIIVIAGKYSSLISRLCRFNAVPVLATLILLSYSKILRTTITIFSPAVLTTEVNSTEVVWLYDGNIQFLEPKHAILFVFGLLVVIFFVIPYTILLLLAPCLQARSHWRCLHWVNRIKPLIDSYQAPFKDKYRFWSGILLLSRLPLYLFFSFVNEPKSMMEGIMVFTYLYIIVMAALSVYKNWFLLLLEMLFIVNMTTIVAANLLNPDISTGFAEAGASVYLLSVLGVILHHAFHQCKRTLWKLFKLKSAHTTVSSVKSDSNRHYGSGDEFYREVLLGND